MNIKLSALILSTLFLATQTLTPSASAQTARSPQTPATPKKYANGLFCTDERGIEIIKRISAGASVKDVMKLYDAECLGKTKSPQEEAMQQAEDSVNFVVARGVDQAIDDLHTALSNFNRDIAKQQACAGRVKINQRPTRARDPFFATMLGNTALSLCGLLDGSVSITDDAQGAFLFPQGNSNPLPMMMRADRSRPIAAKAYGEVENGPYQKFADIRYISALLIMNEFTWESYGLLKPYGVRHIQVQIQRGAAAVLTVQGDTAYLKIGYDIQEMLRGSTSECMTCTDLPQLRGTLTRKSVIQYREYDPTTEIKMKGELPLTQYKPGATAVQVNDQNEVISLSVLTADHFTTPSRDPNISNRMLLIDYPRPAELETALKRSGLQPSGPVHNSPSLREANVMNQLNEQLQRDKAAVDHMLARLKMTGSPFPQSSAPSTRDGGGN